ncbi:MULTISPECIES: RNA polymerase sigma factor [Peribacillus]|uniref:RNA polymerase subunit sigma-70 n=1 Tax=Peribacillus simplex TaxID=1478 RepID=A0A109N1T5_9BACI|nr:RNA polymerase sigma factor [Peribacillus simplex]KWW21908.1 RNA polymerase subunit sigma-70 [Peribacillus simplex]
MDDITKNNVLNSELNIVYRYLRKLGISQADSEDAVQETAYKYLLYYDTIQTSKIRSWLIRVSLNFHYDQCRKHRRYDLNLNEERLVTDIEELPEVIFLVKERNKEVGDALSKLRPHFQELLLLKYQSGLSYEEIAMLIEKPISSIKTNLFRARKRLAKIYKEENHE